IGSLSHDFLRGFCSLGSTAVLEATAISYSGCSLRYGIRLPCPETRAKFGPPPRRSFFGGAQANALPGFPPLYVGVSIQLGDAKRDPERRNAHDHHDSLCV